MIISHKHKFVFIHTPRTGGSAIAKSLIDFLGDGDEVYGYTEEFEELSDKNRNKNIKNNGSEQGKKVWKHSTPKYIKEYLGSSKWNSYFKFCFIRNPLDIHYSWYHWLRNDDYDKSKLLDYQDAIIFAKDNSFEVFFMSEHKFPYRLVDFCATINSEKRVSLKSPFSDGRGIANFETDMNFIGRFEKFKIDLAYVLGRLDLPNVKLQIENASRAFDGRTMALDEIVDNKEARTLLNTRHNLDHIYFDYVDWFHEYNEKYNNYML